VRHEIIIMAHLSEQQRRAICPIDCEFKWIKDPIKRNDTNNEFVPLDCLKKRSVEECNYLYS